MIDTPGLGDTKIPLQDWLDKVKNAEVRNFDAVIIVLNATNRMTDLDTCVGVALKSLFKNVVTSKWIYIMTKCGAVEGMLDNN